jgi:hypothetical protein
LNGQSNAVAWSVKNDGVKLLQEDSLKESVKHDGLFAARTKTQCFSKKFASHPPAIVSGDILDRKNSAFAAPKTECSFEMGVTKMAGSTNKLIVCRFDSWLDQSPGQNSPSPIDISVISWKGRQFGRFPVPKTQFGRPPRSFTVKRYRRQQSIPIQNPAKQTMSVAIDARAESRSDSAPESKSP